MQKKNHNEICVPPQYPFQKPIDGVERRSCSELCRGCAAAGWWFEWLWPRATWPKFPHKLARTTLSTSGQVLVSQGALSTLQLTCVGISRSTASYRNEFPIHQSDSINCKLIIDNQSDGNGTCIHGPPSMSLLMWGSIWTTDLVHGPNLAGRHGSQRIRSFPHNVSDACWCI